MKKKIITSIGVILGIFILLSSAWLLWRNIKYNQYTQGMAHNTTSPFRFFAPIYWLGEDDKHGVVYTVRFPARLFSFTGSLVITTSRWDEEKTGRLDILPLPNGDYRFRVRLDYGEFIYIDSQGNAIDSAFDDIIEQRRDTVEYLLNRAKERWRTLT